MFTIIPLQPTTQIAYAAVDCTRGQNHELCKQEGVEGYPTFNYYNYGKFPERYNGDRGVRNNLEPQQVLSCQYHIVLSTDVCRSPRFPTFLSLTQCFVSLSPPLPCFRRRAL